jgi:hypothetical protein
LKNHFSKKFHGIFRGKSLSEEKNVRKIGPRRVCEKIAQYEGQPVLVKISAECLQCQKVGQNIDRICDFQKYLSNVKITHRRNFGQSGHPLVSPGFFLSKKLFFFISSLLPNNADMRERPAFTFIFYANPL